MKSITADPWNISAADFPANGTTPEKWKFLLGYAVLAPSSHNSQPWLFHVRQNTLELYADRRRACPVVDPHDRELIMSCGCALFHLRCALRHFGYLGPVEIFPEPDPDLVARVSLGTQEETDVEESILFYALPKRRTNRQPFSDDPVPSSLLVTLARAAEAEGARLRFLENQETRYAIADLVAEGDRIQWANKAFRLELSRWVHSNRSPSRDGVPGYAAGIDDLLSYAGPLVVRTFDMGEGQAARNHEVATGSPVLTVLATDGDQPRDWVAGGQALARVLLRARVEDVWVSFLNQPVEVPELRTRLKAVAGHTGFPQAILRLGFGENVKPTPRREVEEVLI
jgi:nitroreductase